MTTWANIIFYIIFLGQIFLLSYYLPGQMLGRLKTVLDTYPPSKYPKLYPKPVGFYIVGQSGFKLAYRLIFVLGFVILFAIIFIVDHASFADDGFISEAWPAGYFFIQILPLILLELLGFSQFKQMRKANLRSTRKALLQPRRLFDYVSPALVSIAVLLIFSSVFLDLYSNGFVINWGSDAMQRSLVIVGTNVLMAGMAAWYIYGRKLDPYQAFGDRAKQVAANLKSMLFVSMAMSVFFMYLVADDVYDLDFLDASLFSLYFQVIAFISVGYILRSLRIEDTDFEVYREEVPIT